MALPLGLTTYTLRFGPITGFQSEDLICTVQVTPNMSVVWNATGQTISLYSESKTFSGTESILWNLPSDADPNLVDVHGVQVKGRLKYFVEWRITDSTALVVETGTYWAYYVDGMASPYQVLLA